MQNVDPVVLLGPVVYILFSAGTIVYWRYRRRFAAVVLVFSAVAYFSAIGLKAVFQDFTLGWFSSAFGATSLATGIYLGAQTSFFEVGLAYLVARVAVSGKKMEARDAEGYGVALAFWENAVLVGGLTLLNLAILYAIIASGLMPASEYQTIVNTEPAVFHAPGQVALPVALGILERVSSFLVHFSWGYLCVLAACLGKRKYLLVALPIGLCDVLTPLAGDVPLWEFEGAFFLLSLGAFFVAWSITKADRSAGYAKGLTVGAPVEGA